MPIHNLKKIYFIVGPTASGKTAMSINLAKEMGSAEIISADSRQIYKDLNLSTGKVTDNEMQGIPHHMLDTVDPGEYFSVVDFTKQALKKIDEIIDRGNSPIVVGGTGFYIDALLYEYTLPDVKKDTDLRKELEGKSVEELYQILKSLNGKNLERFEVEEFKKNKHRLMRAIEVVKSLGYFPPLQKKLRFNNFEIIQTDVPREVLRQKIYSRLLERIEAGMIEEIKLVKQKYNLSFEYLEKLGLEFKWVAKYLKNDVTKDQMIEKLNIEIGQYAKRQSSWFKRYESL